MHHCVGEDCVGSTIQLLKYNDFDRHSKCLPRNASHQLTKEETKIPKIAVGLLLGIIVFGMFMGGFDQSHLFSVAQGEQAYEDLWMHEFYHAMRHATGFPCHLSFYW